MKNEVIKNWIKAALVLVLGCIALVLLMAEPNKVGSLSGSMSKWLMNFVAVKAAAIVCGYLAYKVADDLTKEIKEA